MLYSFSLVSMYSASSGLASFSAARKSGIATSVLRYASRTMEPLDARVVASTAAPAPLRPRASRAGKFGVGYVGVCGIKQFGGVSCAHKQRRFPLRFVP